VAIIKFTYFFYIDYFALRIVSGKRFTHLSWLIDEEMTSKLLIIPITGELSLLKWTFRRIFLELYANLEVRKSLFSANIYLPVRSGFYSSHL